MSHKAFEVFVCRVASRVLLCASALLLTACAASGTPRAHPAPLAEAAVTPLKDLNLIPVEIPPVLKEAGRSPYRMPADLDCAALAGEVEALDEVLGADLDTSSKRERPKLIERGARAVDAAAVGAVRGAVDVVPYRDWVRKLTGAERDSKKVTDAIAAGRLRRAFLKGIGSHAGCEPPAAPQPVAEAETASP